MIRAVCLFFALVASVSALPDGAPVCVIGTPNVNNVHVIDARNPVTGTLERGQWQVSLDGKPISNTATGRNVFFFEANKNITVEVKSTTGKPFRGVLVMLSNNRTPTQNTKGNLSPIGAGWEQAIGCEKLPYVGLSHSENSTKPLFSSTMFWNTTGQTLLLDVNIVEANNKSASIYWYSQYKLKASSVTRKPLCTILRLITGRC